MSEREGWNQESPSNSCLPTLTILILNTNKEKEQVTKSGRTRLRSRKISVQPATYCDNSKKSRTRCQMMPDAASELTDTDMRANRAQRKRSRCCCMTAWWPVPLPSNERLITRKFVHDASRRELVERIIFTVLLKSVCFS